jgi:protoporphyrinogen oxidase
MRREGFHSTYLRWLADYSVRDDYCVRLDGASAWAGIHYFAARDSEEKGPLAWPEGNGWLTQRLLERAGPRVHTGSLVYGIRQEAKRWLVYTERTLWEADFVIFAAPTWLANWLLDPPPPAWPLEYGPWLVANLTLDRWPENRGVDYCWDNVVYDSPTLGYVVATHQNLTTHQPRTVWTFYWALADGRAADQRRVLLGGTWSWWAERILADLERVHPDIRQCVRRLDIFRAAHAMPRPGPGAIFHPERLRRAKPSGSFVYANSDLSALSLFEEALHRGVTAAAHILRGVG